MYCCIQKENENEAFGDLVLAEKMVLRKISGRTEESRFRSFKGLIKVTPLLRLTYKTLAPRTDSVCRADMMGHILVNPPTESKDLDEAYHEAKRLFSELYGDEDFLAWDEGDDVTLDEN